MFSELYGFKLSFKSERCPHLISSDEAFPGNTDYCEHCKTFEYCADHGGSRIRGGFSSGRQQSRS